MFFLGPDYRIYVFSNFFRKLPEIFGNLGYSPVSAIPVSNIEGVEVEIFFLNIMNVMG